MSRVPHALLLGFALCLLAASAPKFPTFALSGLGRPDVASPNLAGKPYLVQFWASWCQSCGGVGAEVEEALNDVGADAEALPALAVSLDESEGAALKSTIERPSARRWFVLDRNRALADAVGNVAVPTVLVVDRSGHVAARLSGHFGAAQRGQLRRVLKEVLQ